MGNLKEFEQAAIDAVYYNACKTETDKHLYVTRICNTLQINADCLISNILSKPVTVNFHPDRFSNNGKLIIENLLTDGKYLGQFQTGTSNGGRTAYIGGERFLWEQRLFSDKYPANTLDRPKYGALNILSYLDGASARFGSCYFVLKQSTQPQCTFAYGDSSTNPETLCTARSFWGVLSALLADAAVKNRLLNIENCPLNEAIKILLSNDRISQLIGRNLDYCIETHIHGEVLLDKDIEALYLDGSFKNTEIQSLADTLSKKYKIGLHWIPKRQIRIDSIDDNFRGPMIRPLAEKIGLRFGDGTNVINAALIGKASCESIIKPDMWGDIGNGIELFQYFKQLWHTTAYYGYLS
jgi:hypothetical protein